MKHPVIVQSVTAGLLDLMSHEHLRRPKSCAFVQSQWQTHERYQTWVKETEILKAVEMGDVEVADLGLEAVASLEAMGWVSV